MNVMRKNYPLRKPISIFTALLMIFLPGTYVIAAQPLEQAQEFLVPETSLNAAAPATSPGTTAPSPKTTTDFLMNTAALALATPATSYYVSPTGSNVSDGSQATPWQSIQYAVNQLAPGDTLYLLEGTYEDYAILGVSGTADSPITIEGLGQVTLDATNLTYPNPDFPQETLHRVIFDTGSQDYINFRNLKITNAGGGIHVNTGSDHILIDGLKTDGARFGIEITDASFVTVQNSEAVNSWNGFHASGTSHDLLFENVTSYFSKDDYASLDINYINGDGFGFESQTSNITLRNTVSAHHWDSGFDIKGTNVLVENAVAFGNKNGFKTWGENITIRNSLIYNSLSQTRSDGTTIDGAGINLIQGTLNVVHSTIADAQAQNIIIRAPGTLTLTDSVIARRQPGDLLLNLGSMTANNNFWFRQGQTDAGFALPAGNFYADPIFQDPDNFNYQLAATSPATGLGADQAPVNDPRPGPPPSNGTILNGLTSDQTVSGTLSAEINPAAGLDVFEMRYFIDGQGAGREFAAPFRLGGSAGFDTKTLGNGAHVLTVLVLAKNQNILPFLIPFTVNNVVAPPSGDFVGVANGSTVSGTIFIQPNLTIHPGIRKVAYYLNDAKSGKVYQAPFFWGGPTGNGTQGFDTRTLADASYALTMIYTDATGDHVATISFTVLNTTQTNDTTAPVISAVTSTNITSTGATINWTTDEVSDSQVEYRIQGTLNWSATDINTALVTNHSASLTGLTANTIYEYRVKSKDLAGNPATQTVISTLTTAAAPSNTDIVGVENGATVSGTIFVQPNLTKYPTTRKVAYYLNGTQSGKYYAAPFTWGGTGGFDTRTLADGAYTLGGAFTTAAGDQPFAVTFTVNNSAPDTTAPVISGVTSSSITSAGATITWATNEPGDSQVEYRIQGAVDWLATNIDTALVTNHSMALIGLTASTVYEYRVKSKDAAQNLATQPIVSSFTTAPPTTGAAVFSVTSPANGATIPAGTIVIDFDVQNFTIGGLGEPHIRFYIDSDPEPYEFYNGAIQEVWYLGVHTHFTHWRDSSSIEVFAFADGPHQLRFVEVDASGTPLPNPEATQTVSFTVQTSTASGFFLQPVATGLEFPSSMMFDASGRVFYNELFSGNIRLMDPGFVLRPQPFYHLNIQTGTDRGLLGIELDPDFQNNHYVYAYYSDADNTNKIVRLTEVDGVGTDLTVILGNLPSNPGHNGGNLHFGPDGKLYLSIGDLTDSVAAQDLGSLKGKILRINKDGTIPADNPFVGQVGNRPEIWAYGLRNSFDFTFHPVTGDLWATENGPDLNDEINRIVRGGNYGWPVVTGIAGDPRFIDPILQITPTVAPTGIAVIRNDSPYLSIYHDRIFFAEWNTGKIQSITLTGPNLDQLGAIETVYAGGEGGILDLMPGPDGKIYAAGIDGIFRVEPGSGSSDPNAPILGVTNGATVSGIVRIYPNLSLFQHLKKVAYYLNGTQSGKYYDLPFMWGGPDGFDTRTLPNGIYTVAGTITSQVDGDHPFSVTFTVAN